MNIVCLDLEGVLVPEIWVAFAQESGIHALTRTTQDEPDYDKLMKENPEKAMWYAVNGMLPNNAIARKAITRLKVYANDVHNHEAQNPVAWTGEIK